METTIAHGTVIDHIPSNCFFNLIHLLQIDTQKDDTVFFGFNLQSRSMSNKGIIIMANRYFTEKELNQISVVAPNVTINIIQDSTVTEKITAHIPTKLINIVRCNNPKCISNNEPMPTTLYRIGKQAICHYCEKSQNIEKLQLI